MTNLKTKAVKGIGWSAIDGLSSTGITFLVGLILARLLSPSEFGLIGMVAIFIAISNSIVDSGFSSALIQKSNASRIDYNTVFYFNILIGVFLYVILFFLAPTISVFFQQPDLIKITRFIGFILIINSFGLVQRTLLVKRVDFKTQTIVSLISSISSGFIGVIMALKGFGVWSLVYQQLSKQLINTFFLWVFNSWRPRVEFSIDSFRQLFGFGSKLLFAGILDTIYKNSYYLIIGKYYSSKELGYYTRSEQFNSILANNLSMLVQRVSYPLLCTIKDDNERLKTTVQKLVKYSTIVTFSSLFGLAAIAKSLVLILIGAKWLPAVPYIQIMCFSGIFYSLSAINLNLLMVKGRTDLFLILEIIKKIIGVFPILVGIIFDIELMLWSVVITSFISYYLNSFYSKSMIEYSFYSQIKDIFPFFVISSIVSLIIWSIVLLNYSPWIIFSLQFVFGIILTIFIYETLKIRSYIDVKVILIEYSKKLIKK